MRAAQGFVGGEWGGAALMAVENAPRKWRSLYSSGVQVGASVGLLLANAAIKIVSGRLPEADFRDWGWRVPFLLSAAIVIVGLVVRVTVEESAVFTEQVAARPVDQRQRLPLLAAMKAHPAGFFAIIGLRSRTLHLLRRDHLPCELWHRRVRPGPRQHARDQPRGGRRGHPHHSRLRLPRRPLQPRHRIRVGRRARCPRLSPLLRGTAVRLDGPDPRGLDPAGLPVATHPGRRSSFLAERGQGISRSAESTTQNLPDCLPTQAVRAASLLSAPSLRA
ncbi:MFS transporter [Streptomyces sp. NPDC002896]|uniref:MFS transporter n=1 Tax=Streptomyces sp. NPDC002896 TaxID=3154438 RepID=UPI00331C2BDE